MHKLNCIFQTRSMVSTTSKYYLFKKYINLFTPALSKNDCILQENTDISYSLFDITYGALWPSEQKCPSLIPRLGISVEVTS